MLENFLSELQIKGQLSEKGLLKESYSEETEDLKHELTERGKEEIRKILSEPKYREIFIKMAMEEARNNPEIARELLKSAKEKLNGLF